MIEFWYKVGPKPVGNWRPKIDLGFSWKTEDVTHNPEIKSVYLVAPAPNTQLDAKEVLLRVKNYLSLQDLGSTAIGIFLSSNEDDESWSIYSEPNIESRTYLAVNDTEQWAGIKIIDKCFPKESRKLHISFYGPYKYGRNPTYEEIVPVILDVRTVITTMLTYGKESGEASELSEDLVFMDGEWISKEESEKRKERDKKIRAIELPEDDQWSSDIKSEQRSEETGDQRSPSDIL